MSQSNAPNERESPLNNAALIMLVVALVSTGLGPFWYLTQTPRLDGALAATLLFLPTFLILFGAVRLLTVRQESKLLTFATAAIDLAKNALVAAYVYCANEDLLHGLAWLTLIIAAVLVVLVYRLTSWIMNAHLIGQIQPQAARIRRQGVIAQLREHRFLGVCGLLVAYLHLVLFLSLAIAFHDRAMPGHSIERQVRGFESPASNTTASEPQRVSEAELAAAPLRTFAFPLGSTSLRCTSAAASHKNAPTDDFFDERNTNDWRVERLRESKLLADHDCSAELRETAWNLVQLHWLEDELSKIYERTPHERYRVDVVAHATDHKPSSSFSSNYEMSRARAEQVQALIEMTHSKVRMKTQGRSPLNLEWQIRPSVAGQTYLASATSGYAGRLKGAGLSRQLTTEVQVTRIPDHLTALQLNTLRPEPTQLQLLDYVYFMTTVAAANDLAPASSFVQFVAAAGHISQLFLLVVAFNVMLAYPRPSFSAQQMAARDA